MKYVLPILALLLSTSALAADISGLAESRKEDLRFSTYICSGDVKHLAAKPAAREASLKTFAAVGVTKLMLEAYRGGVEATPEELSTLRDYYEGKGFDVIGGIATVAGKGFGVEATGMGWFNYQAEKTRTDLERVCRSSAKVFDTVIVDDFLCTIDESEMSIQAKGDRSWSDYRRALMTDVAKNTIVGPMHEENPNIHVIVKFPQWYDRFHLFGYEVEQYPAIFDGVWVGTETRGRNTQRFGFTQPYEGFVNYTWLAGLSGDKIQGAWFDYGDCDANDFMEQAWTTVLAGAREIVLFQYQNLLEDLPAHEMLGKDFTALADLAKATADTPRDGVAAYKPPHSDPGGDLYLMDHIGMFGVPLIPIHRFPEEYRNIFLPTQAAADPDVVAKTEHALERGINLVVTLGFLADAKNGDRLAELAGVASVLRNPMMAKSAWCTPFPAQWDPKLGIHVT